MSKARDLAGLFNLGPRSGTTAQRPATADVGDIYYNGTTGKTEIYTTTGWKEMASGIPFGNTAGRPTAVTGQPYFNGETARLELYTGNSWENIVQEVPGVASISGTYSEATDSGVITINGTNFVSGAYATAIGSNGVQINAASTVYNSLVQLTATFTGLSNAQEPYDIKVTNPSNLFGLIPDALYINASPVWQTASGSLGSFTEQVSISVSATATDSDSTITYALASGSTLPTGVTLNSSTGSISGTLPDINSDTTYNFTINASDGVNTIPRSFSITSNYSLSAEYLIVGAGGNGGFDNGVGATAGGGGAGGYLSGSQAFARGVPINFSVGAAPALSTSGTGFKGQDSYIGSLVAYAGGAGQYYSGSAYIAATSGGSGGGGGYSQRTGGAGTLGQGNAGGNGVPNSDSPYTGGGGGGAGGVGVSATVNGQAGAGGPGLSNSITGTPVIYAAGGGGALGNVSPGSGGVTGGAGGSNGVGGFGGNGNNANAGDGAANTGSGGGGKYGLGSPTGGRGSAGVVVIAYPNTMPAPVSISAGLTYDQPTRAGYRVYRFTAGTGTVTF
jgi:hypothetical protein